MPTARSPDHRSLILVFIDERIRAGLKDHADSQAKGGKGKNPKNPEDVQAGQSDRLSSVWEHG
jgi:hypothetical protein